jgi:hypothetical protein
MKITSPRLQHKASRPEPDSDPDHRRYSDRVVEAAEHVGKTWIEELQWLVDLAQRSPEQLIHQLTEFESPLVYEVAWFSREVSIVDRESDRTWIVNAAESLKLKLRSLLETGQALFEVSEVTFVLNRRTDDGSKRSGRAARLESFHRAKNPETRFLLGAHRILELEGVRLRKCAAPGCERIFVRQKRAIFCGQKCSQREQTRRHRERNPEYAKIRQRKYYENKTKKKISRMNGRRDIGVKVGSRPRGSK